jgi:hypothetical protein
VDQAHEIALDRAYLQGHQLHKGRLLFYAVRWRWLFVASQLPGASAALLGFRRATKDSMRDPLPWQLTLLAAQSILQNVGGTPAERAEAAAAILLEFDLYSRPGELLLCAGSDLLPHQEGFPL